MKPITIPYSGGELTKAHENDLGFDLKAQKIIAVTDYYTGKLITKKDLEKHPYSDYYKFDFPYTLKPRFRVCVDTGVVCDFPDNVGAIIKPRSGLAYNFGVDVLAGVIDPGYRDSIKVILINFSEVSFVINEGDRIAQLLIVNAANVQAVKKDTINLETDRGLGGFGSTGK